jgi:electron transfer flavoprotein alpha subunit
VEVLVAGKDCGAAAQQASSIAGVAKVLHVEDAALQGGIAENVAKLLASLQRKNGASPPPPSPPATDLRSPQPPGYGHIVASATNAGRNTAPRLAAILDVAPLSDVTAVHSPTEFERPMYAGNALARVRSEDKVKVMTVRTTAFDKAAVGGGSAPVESVPGCGDAGKCTFVSEERTKSERPTLAAASIVVSGGRALKSADNFKLIYGLADALGAGVGASRAAVDAGYVGNDTQVGQTGKVVAPNLYVAVGISGAIQHLAGMKDSKVIVAVNKDPEAPIFQVADFGLAEDLFKAVPELTAKITAGK